MSASHANILHNRKTLLYWKFYYYYPSKIFFKSFQNNNNNNSEDSIARSVVTSIFIHILCWALLCSMYWYICFQMKMKKDIHIDGIWILLIANVCNNVHRELLHVLGEPVKRFIHNILLSIHSIDCVDFRISRSAHFTI